MVRTPIWVAALVATLIACLFGTEARGETRCGSLIENETPRGMLCLQCLSKRAPRGVTPFVSLLQDTCLKRIALGFVTDGSFGFDEARLIEAVQGLSAGGRSGHLHLYIYNGPAQRRWQSGLFSSFAAMDPFQFRHKILEDPATQDAMQHSVRRLSKVLTYAAAQNVSVSIAPGLEDNLGDESFAKALSLIKEALPPDVSARWVRSPCLRCSYGNDSSIPQGVAREVHTKQSDFSSVGGVVSNDGEHIRFSFESTKTPEGDILPRLSALRPTLKRATALKNIFLLWIPKYQDSPYGVVPVSPNIRSFKKPTPRERREILTFLASPIHEGYGAQ